MAIAMMKDSAARINDDLFDYASTTGGKKVAYLPAEDTTKVVQMSTAEEVKAAAVYNPVQDKVFSQNPKAGTLVRRGTTVDIILVEKASAKVGMVEATHADLGSQSLVEVYDTVIEGNDAVIEVVDKYSKGQTITADEKILMDKTFTGSGISVVEGDRTKDFDSAMKAVTAAYTYGRPVF